MPHALAMCFFSVTSTALLQATYRTVTVMTGEHTSKVCLFPHNSTEKL